MKTMKTYAADVTIIDCPTIDCGLTFKVQIIAANLQQAERRIRMAMPNGLIVKLEFVR